MLVMLVLPIIWFAEALCFSVVSLSCVLAGAQVFFSWLVI